MRWQDRAVIALGVVLFGIWVMANISQQVRDAEEYQLLMDTCMADGRKKYECAAMLK